MPSCLIVLIAAAALVQVWQIRVRTFADMERETRVQAGAGTAFTRQVFGGAMLALQSIGSEAGSARIVVAGSRPELHMALMRAQATSPAIQGLTLVGRDGRVWVNADSISPMQSDLSDRPYFIAHREGQGNLRARQAADVTARPLSGA